VVVLAFLFACTISKAVSTVSLEWSPNTDPSVAGYNVYYGSMSRDYTNVISVGNSTNAVVEGLVEGETYYFAVTAYDDFGGESDYSDETIYIVPVTGLTLTLEMNPDGPMHIRFPITTEHWYELQMSPDLINWHTTWAVNGYDNTWVQFDAPMTNSLGFFRVIQH